MANIYKIFLSVALMFAALGAKAADCLWIIGPATPYGWETDRTTALLKTPGTDTYTGTIYLKAGEDFKFMTQPEWGNEEYGAAPGATLHDGVIAIAKGTDDNGYDKIQVPENANYCITVNTSAMTATIVKSAYQQTEISICLLFMVGSAMPNGWDVMLGTPLYQNQDAPAQFRAQDLELEAGSFKIAIALKGACSFSPEYWYFRNADDAGKIARDQEGDLQWEIAKKGKYTVSVDVLTGTIAITLQDTSGAEAATVNTESETEYYTLTGIRVINPANGVYIRKNGTETSKVFIR